MNAKCEWNLWKSSTNNSANKWGRGGALAIGTMAGQSTPQPITGPLLARAPGLQPRLAQWLMRPCLYWWMATLHGLLPPASQLLSSIHLFSCLSPRTGGSSPQLAGSQVCSTTPDQAAPRANSGLISIHSEPQQNNAATAFHFTITHTWTFCSCCLQVLHP